MWEGGILKKQKKEKKKKAFQSIVLYDPHLGFIDIGANLGLYSLVAASMGHNVISIEPFDNNLRRFHKSISLGEWMFRVGEWIASGLRFTKSVVYIYGNGCSYARHDKSYQYYVDYIASHTLHT